MAAETIRWAGMRLTVEGAAEFQTKLKDINAQLRLSQSELNKATSAFDKNEQNTTTLEAKYGHLKESLRLNAEWQKSLNMKMEDAKTHQQSLEATLAKLNERKEENTDEIKKNEAELEKNSKALIALQTNLNEAQAAQSKLEKALKDTDKAMQGQKWEEFGRKMEESGKRWKAVGDKMQSVGKGLSLAVTTPIMGIATAATHVGSTFEKEMANLSAITGMTADEMQVIERGIRDIALETGVSVLEVAGNAKMLAESGGDLSLIMEQMAHGTNLAIGTQEDLATTFDFVGSAMKTFNVDAENTQSVVDSFASVTTLANTTLTDLGYAYVNTGGAAAAAEMSIDDVNAVLVTFSNAGLKGGAAGTSLNRILADLSAPTDKAANALNDLGIALYDTEDNSRGMFDILRDLEIALSDMDDQSRNAAESAIFNSVALKGWNMITNEGVDAIIELSQELSETSQAFDGLGQAAGMAAEATDTLQGRTDKAKAQFNEMCITLYESLQPALEQTIGTVTDVLKWFNGLDESTQQNIIKMAALAAAIGPVLVIGGKLVTTAGGIMTAFGGMTKAVAAAGSVKAAFALKFPLLTAGFAGVKAGLTAATAGIVKFTAAMLANPIGAAVAAVGLLVGITAYLVIKLNKASEEYKQLHEDSENWLERQKEIAAATAEQAAAFEQNTRNMQNNAEFLRNLSERLEELASKQELTAGEMAEMDDIISTLNSSVDGLNIAYDEQAGALNMTVDALNDYLTAAEAQEKLDAQLAERARLQREVIDLAAEQAEAEQRLLELQEMQEDGTKRNNKEKKLLKEAIEMEQEALALLTEAMEANGEMQDALSESIEIHAQALEDMQRAQEEAAAAIVETTGAMQEQAFSAEEWEQAQKDAFGKIEKAFESYKRVASNAFSTVSENTAISVQEMTENLQENTRAVEEWSKNLAILAERAVDEGLLEQLRQAGPQTAATVRELVDATDEELDLLNNAFEDSTRVAIESMQRELDPKGVTQSAEELIDHVALAILNNTSMEDALVDTINNAFGALDITIANIGFDGLGKNTVTGYVDGINNMLPKVDSAGHDTADTYLDAITAAFDMHSPSREMQKIGVNAGEGLIQGTKDIQPQTEDIARTLATAFINNVADRINQSQDIDNATRRQVEDIRRTADSAVSAANFQSVGQEIANGVASGIQNGGGIVSSAANNLINNALSSMRAAAAIQSPSRKTHKIGQQLIEGITGGLSSKMGELAAMCERITDKVMEGLHIDPSELIDNAKDVLNSMQTALPALEGNIRYVTGPQAAFATASPAPQQGDVHFHFGAVNVREESDIEKIVNMALRKLGKDVNHSGKIKGVRMV